MLIRPPENGALQILHVCETGRTQARGKFGGALTNRAIGNDRNIICRTEQTHFRGSPRIDTPRPGEVAHIPFLHRPNIEKRRRRTMSIFQPIRQFARRDPLHLRELAAQRGPQQKPLKFARPARAISGDKHDESSYQNAQPRCRRAGWQMRTNDLHLKNSVRGLMWRLIFAPKLIHVAASQFKRGQHHHR
jgi:hypothetical protein